MRRPIVPAPLSLHLRPAAATWAASRDCHEHDRRSAREIDFAMTAPLKTVEASTVVAVMRETGRRAKSAARALALAPTAQKDKALAAMAEAIRAHQAHILSANADDMAEAKAAGATAAFLDRLGVDETRITALAGGLDVRRALAAPVLLVRARVNRLSGTPRSLVA